MQELNWNDLRFVLAVARTEPLSRAARRLGVNESGARIDAEVAADEAHLNSERCRPGSPGENADA